MMRLPIRCTPLFAPALLSVVLGVAVLGVAACGAPPGAVGEEEAKVEIQALLEEYLPLVGEAYRTQDASVLEDYVVAKERVRTEARIEELALQGIVYQPEFESVTVENASVWNYSNAFASTLEVWNVRSTTLSGDQILQEVPGQRNRVKYQLKRKDDRWVVVYRELAEAVE